MAVVAGRSTRSLDVEEQHQLNGGNNMNKTVAALSVAVIAGFGLGAAANMPGPPPTPSASLGIEVDVKPADGTPGQFVVTSVVTDLENGAVIAKPRLTVAANKPARIETGTSGKWTLQINVIADGASRKATYDASFTREGKLVSKQRVSVNLDV
jgi:hypothetical protein